MSVDTALFIMSAGETKEDSTLVGFTELKEKEVCFRMCDLQYMACHAISNSDAPF